MKTKVLIVAKTRRGGGACVGGITWEGRSVRLVACDADHNEHAGMEYQVGEVWDIEGEPDPQVCAPHVENTIVYTAQRVSQFPRPERFIHRYMPPIVGNPSVLFDGLLQVSPSGGLFIADRTGLPSHSTMFWIPDQPLHLDCEGKRIRYRYVYQTSEHPQPAGLTFANFPQLLASTPAHQLMGLSATGGVTLTFVGFQEPLETIPSGTLLRVSLAHRWRPKDKPAEELRCYVQLSGWFLDTEASHREGIKDRHSAQASNISNESIVPRSQTAVASKARASPAPALDFDRARQFLKHIFGFTQFLPLQEEIISHLLHRRDALAIMPTGGGKSLCYQLPALMFDGLTVVVSPLIALMQDQVNQLRELDVPAAFLNSTVALRDYVAITSQVRRGWLKILYAAPETLLRPETLLLLEQSRLACLAIDEAHCISEWGHDFRPEYRQLHEVRRRFSQAVCVALTATATPRVRGDICRLLGIDAAGEFVGRFNRPNLFLAVQSRKDGLAQTLAFLEQHREQPGIIYCSKRQQVDDLSAKLCARGWPALPYHAGLDDAVRQRNQDQFIRDEATIMVATVAFGMGINKANVRFILHYNLPKDLESYYQEVGRAGRDGLPSDCLLLHSRADAITHRYFIDEGAVSERPGRQARLEAMTRFAEAAGCRRVPLLNYFGETTADHCGHCDHCRVSPEPAEQVDVTVAAQKFFSCIKRTGEHFGAAHIIEVLRGSHAKKVIKFGHDRLSTYGIGREYSALEWRELVQQFVTQGLLEQDMQYGSLKLTERAWRVMKGEPVLAQPFSQASPPVPASSPAPGTKTVQAEHDHELFQELRQLRQELAAQANVPAYIVFSDRSLLEMATHFPQEEAQFLAINGVGAVKLERYGRPFLQVIRDYCILRKITPRNQRVEIHVEPVRWLTVQRRFQEVGELFSAGHSLEELQNRYDVQRETILQHLNSYVEAGGRLDPNHLLRQSRLSSSDQQRVFASFAKLGFARLSPIRETVGNDIPYDELHLLRLYLMTKTVSGKETSNHTSP